MRRRGFLGALLGATATAAACGQSDCSADQLPVEPIEHVRWRAVLDQLDRLPTPTTPNTVSACFPQYPAGERLGDYVLYFNCFRPSIDNDWLVGQMVAWRALPPGSRTIPADARWFYAPVPGPTWNEPRAYEYTPGAVFRIHSGITLEHFATADGLRHVRAEIDNARTALINYLQLQGVVA